ncbi:hypothetical protein, partial [Pseudomonas urmiensis]|uniref:hypothetical protein n=1 Tax=Pseudomonas urmiensis TaxID=2745493 RepID=UPI0034D3CA7A
VTPDMARKYLECNNGSRPVRKQWVAELARRIRDGEWRQTHQGIAFDSDGNVLDGQHRLMAIVLANLPVSIMVFNGFDIENPMDFPADDML